jgi:hypothetical protein
MTLDEVIALLRAECEKAGGQAAWAKAHRVSPAYVGDVIRGRRDPGDGILLPLGVEKCVTYQLRSSDG